MENRLADEEMLRASEALGRLSLGNNFVPQEFSRDEAREILAAMGWKEPDKLDPLQRLIDNGVVIEKSAAATMILRFALDPVAEFLAATAYAKDCGTAYNCWAKLIAQVRDRGEKAAGFLTALTLVWQAYHDGFNWPEINFTFHLVEHEAA